MMLLRTHETWQVNMVLIIVSGDQSGFEMRVREFAGIGELVLIAVDEVRFLIVDAEGPTHRGSRE